MYVRYGEDELYEEAMTGLGVLRRKDWKNWKPKKLIVTSKDEKPDWKEFYRVHGNIIKRG